MKGQFSDHRGRAVQAVRRAVMETVRGLWGSEKQIGRVWRRDVGGLRAS